MGLLSRFETKMEDTMDSAADRLFDSPLSPVQIEKKAEKQMNRERIVGSGKQYAPTLYTVLVNYDDDARLFGYYPTLAGEVETYLSAKAAEHGYYLDGQPLVRFIPDESLRPGKFDVVAEMVSAPIVEQLRDEEMERYGLYAQSTGAPYESDEADYDDGYEDGYADDFEDLPYDNDDYDPYSDPNYQQPRGTAYEQPYEGSYQQPYEEEAYVAQAAGRNDYPTPLQQAQSRTMVFPSTKESPAQQHIQRANQIDHRYLEDPATGRRYTLVGDHVVIGRDSSCGIVLNDINASRRHAELYQDIYGEWVINDIGSTNGTYVNGHSVKSITLADGARINIGKKTLIYRIG